ncbi:mannose-1-phosphate guanylyltransferase [Gammaproteobacteria bacterium]
MHIQPVILSGGAGTRLWPLSRKNHPKQLLPLAGDQTLLQQTATRLQGLGAVQGRTMAAPLVVCNEEHRFLVTEQLREVDHMPWRVILEPEGRNTAPALTLAALALEHTDQEAVMLVMPADHVINDLAAFQAAVVRGAARVASEESLATFGIIPTSPHTGYGYLHVGSALAEVVGGATSHHASASGDTQTYRLDRFVEKPNLPTAQEYLAAGTYLWNSGMFMMRARVWLHLLERLEPAMAQACRAAYEAGHLDGNFYRIDRTLFAACPSNSIDYAVMERITGAGSTTGIEAVVVPLAAGWSDVGAWPALWEISPQDAASNVIRGDVLTHATRNSLILAQHRLVATVGLEDAVIIETADAVLVANKDHAQDVKEVVEQLKHAKRTEHLDHLRVSRPWGTYEGIDRGERFQVKRIIVRPGAKLSLQMHHHRAEHWVVVKGTARVTQGDEVFLLTENQSTYIPLGVRHRLENPGKLPLEIIEVQSGSYLGEDDIVRFEDSYGRDHETKVADQK